MHRGVEAFSMSSRSISGEPTRYPTLDRTATLRVLVPAERRRVLSLVLDSTAPIDTWTLAERAVADERGTSISDVPEADAKSMLARLQQIHLPALDDAGLVTWYTGDALVSPTGHPGLRDPLVLRLLRRDDAEDVIEALADRRRRNALAVLQAERDTMSVSALAESVAERDPDGAGAVDHVSVSLRHAHLPKLDAAGLVEYDREDATVTYCGHPVVEGPWFGWSDDEAGDPRSPSGSPGNHENHEGD